MTTARFDINGSPASDGGYNAAHSEALTITLEDLPATDVRKVRVRVVLKSDGAPALSFTEQPSPPVAPVVITMPSAAAGLVAYLIEVQINDGVRLVNGKITVVPEWTFQRLVVAPVPIDKVRATIYREESQYEAQGLANLITALARAVASGSAVIPSPLPAPVITTIEELDGDGNDVLVHMSAWLQTVTDAFEVHAPNGVLADASAGYVSMAAGMSAATGLGAGVFQFDAAGRIQLISLADGFYAEAIGDAFETFGESVWRGGVTSTVGAVQLGTADGAGELPAAITIGGLPGSGTHAVALQGRVLTVQGALSLELSAPTVTINGQPMVAKVAEIVATANVTQSGAQTIDGVGVGSGTARTVLCVGQSTPTQNGLFDAPAGGGAWTRRADFDSLAEYVLGTVVTIQAGTAGKGKRYRLDALSSSLPATWEDITGGGGATDSISDGGSSVSTDNATGIDATTDQSFVAAADAGIQLDTSAGGAQLSAFEEVSLLADGAGHDHRLVLDSTGFTWTSEGTQVRTDWLDGSDFSSTYPDGVGWLVATTDTGTNASTIDLRSANNFQTLAGTGYSHTRGIGSGYSAAHEVLDVSTTSLRRRVYGTANTLGLTETVNAAACTTAVVGDWTATAANTTITSTTTTTLNCTYFSMTASGGSASVTCSLVGRFNGYGGLELNSNTGQVGMGHPALEDEIIFVLPSSVTPGSSAATSIGTITVPANSSGRFVGTIGVRNGSSNDKQMDVTLDWNAGATVASRNLSVTATTVQGTIGTVAGDVTLSDSGLVITVRVANASGFRCALRGRASVNL